MSEFVDEPLPGMPEGRRKRRKPTTVNGRSIRSYKGKPATCHLCTLHAARGALKTPRQPATHEINEEGDIWLLCSLHTSDLRSGSLRLPTRNERKFQ